MKKRCTPENNAMHIHTHVECPAPIVPIVNGCLDPFTYTWNAVVSQALLDPTVPVVQHFDLLLDKGQVLSSAANICCPDCTTSPIYVLASVETFAKLAEALGWWVEPDLTCCINIQASIETYVEYSRRWEIEQYPCCNNDFESCLNKLSTIASLDRILDKGVVETNGYNGNTLLCIIYDLFLNTPEDLLQGSTISEVFDRLLDKGFVVYCCGCNVVIASVETFLKWWDATGGCGTVTPPPKPA